MVYCCQPHVNQAIPDCFMELEPCRHCLCARCYHRVIASGKGIDTCPACHERVRSSAFLCLDSTTGNIAERGEAIEHPSLLWRLVLWLYRRIHALLRLAWKYAQNPRLLFLEMTPEHNPLLWCWINGFVVFYSIFLLATVYHYEASGHKQRKKALRFADQSYLVYDFATTSLWVLETILGLLTIRREHWVFSKCIRVVHLMIAALFLSDSFETLQKWKWKQEDIEVDALWVLGDLLAYTLALVETMVWFFWQRRDARRNNPQQSLLLDKMEGTLHHDPLLAKLLPFYDACERQFEKRSSRTLKTDDFTQLAEALYPAGLG